MTPFLKADELWPGLILNMSSKSRVGGLIRFALRGGFRKLQEDFPMTAGDVCPNHDAMIVEHKGALYVGEAAFPAATIRTLDEYNAWIEAGTQFNVRILEPKIANKKRQRMAAEYWMENIFGTWYDFLAIPSLGLKAAFGKWWPFFRHWEFAFYCTEGIAESYTFGAGCPAWGKKFPTPLTTLKRRCQGTFRLIKEQKV